MTPRFKPSIGWDEFKHLFKRNKGAITQFEKDFAKKFESVDAVAFPYGRSAQWAFLKAVGLEKKEVIMPAYTCSVVAHAVSLSGNKPCFIDIDLNDFNMNLRQAESNISEKTGAIIATHTFGYPQNLDALEAMISRAEKKYGNKIWLIQDCCHAFGARWHGKLIGGSGDVAIYAFNISKIITSIFGGMLTFQNQELADRTRIFRNTHFKRASASKTLRRKLYFLAVYFAFNKRIYGIIKWLNENTAILNKLTKDYHLDDKVHFPPDYLESITDLEASIGSVQLKKYDSIVDQRKNAAQRYDETLKDKEGWHLPPIRDGATYSHYTVRVPNREKTIKKYKDLGIELGELIQYSIPNLDCYGGTKEHESALKASKTTINLPLHHE